MAYDVRAQVMGQTGVPVGIPSSGTVAANGALTLTTALLLTYANIWLYFPAGAVYANSPAGLYFCQMTSTTLGTIFNNTLPANQLPFIPAVLNPVVASGPGAYTQTTGSALTVAQYVLPGGTLGKNGSLESVHSVAWANNGNNKTFGVQFGGQTWGSVNQTTNATAVHQKLIANRGSEQSQFTPATGQIGYGASSSGSPSQLTQDTTQIVTISYQGTLAVATDFMVWDDIRLVAYITG